MANTDTSVVTAGVNNYFDRKMLRAARPRLVHLRWAQVRDIPANNSMVIKFRRYGLLTANTVALSEGVTPSGTALSITDVSGTLAQYGDYVTLTDVLQFSTLDPLMNETADKLGQQAGNSLDQITRDVMVAGTTAQYASSATTTNTVTASMTLTRAEIREAVRTLQGNDAEKVTSMINPSNGFNTSPINAAYIGIISHNTLFDLRDEAGFIPVEEYASQANVMDGEVGAMEDVRFVMTTNASTTTGSLATVHRTLILAQDYYGISRVSGEAMKNIIKPLGSGGTADPLDQRSTSGWKATFLAKRLNENFCVRIEHGVTA